MRPKQLPARDPNVLYRLPLGLSPGGNGPYLVVAQQGSGNKIQDIKAIRACARYGLKEAKQIADNLPAVIGEGLSLEFANDMQKKLEDAGMTAQVKEVVEREG